MVENICAEALLTGLLWVNNKSIDLNTSKNYYESYTNQITYVLPDDYSLALNECINEKLSKKIPNKDMKEFIIKLN